MKKRLQTVFKHTCFILTLSFLFSVKGSSQSVIFQTAFHRRCKVYHARRRDSSAPAAVVRGAARLRGDDAVIGAVVDGDHQRLAGYQQDGERRDEIGAARG